MNSQVRTVGTPSTGRHHWALQAGGGGGRAFCEVSLAIAWLRSWPRPRSLIGDDASLGVCQMQQAAVYPTWGNDGSWMRTILILNTKLAHHGPRCPGCPHSCRLISQKWLISKKIAMSWKWRVKN